MAKEVGHSSRLEKIQNNIIQNEVSGSSIQIKALSASVGGFLATVAVTPFDVIKSRLQNETFSAKDAPPHERPCGAAVKNGLQQSWSSPQQNKGLSMFGQTREILRTEGVGGFFNGLRPAIVGSVPSIVAYMVIYDQLSEYLKPRFGNVWTPLIAGASSRTLVTVFGMPLELIKIRIQAFPQVGGIENRLGIIDLVRKVVVEEGTFALWRGTAVTLMRDVPFSMIYWGSYEAMKQAISDLGPQDLKDSPTLVAFSAGASSSMLATIVSMPFDVIKTKQQIIRNGVTMGGIPSMISIGKQIKTNEGFQGFFRGISPRMIRTVPSSAIMISSYETGKIFFSKHKEDSL